MTKEPDKENKEVSDTQSSDAGVSADGAEYFETRWKARTMQPIIVLYVVAVFVILIAMSYFVFNSMTGVTSLAMVGFGTVVALLPGLLVRIEYRMTKTVLEKRTHNKKKPGTFKRVFQLDQLSHIVPLRHGFKYYKSLDEPNPLKRFWKNQISDAYSGEVHLEIKDRKRILDLLSGCGIKITKKDRK